MSSTNSDNATSRNAAVERSGTEPVACGWRAGASRRRAAAAAGPALGERDLLRGPLPEDVDGEAGIAGGCPELDDARRFLAMDHPHRGADIAPQARTKRSHSMKPMAT